MSFFGTRVASTRRRRTCDVSKYPDLSPSLDRVNRVILHSDGTFTPYTPTTTTTTTTNVSIKKEEEDDQELDTSNTTSFVGSTSTTSSVQIKKENDLKNEVDEDDDEEDEEDEEDDEEDEDDDLPWFGSEGLFLASSRGLIWSHLKLPSLRYMESYRAAVNISVFRSHPCKVLWYLLRPEALEDLLKCRGSKGRYMRSLLTSIRERLTVSGATTEQYRAYLVDILEWDDELVEDITTLMTLVEAPLKIDEKILWFCEYCQGRTCDKCGKKMIRGQGWWQSRVDMFRRDIQLSSLMDGNRDWCRKCLVCMRMRVD